MVPYTAKMNGISARCLCMQPLISQYCKACQWRFVSKLRLEIQRLAQRLLHVALFTHAVRHAQRKNTLFCQSTPISTIILLFINRYNRCTRKFPRAIAALQTRMYSLLLATSELRSTYFFVNSRNRVATSTISHNPFLVIVSVILVHARAG